MFEGFLPQAISHKVYLKEFIILLIVLLYLLEENHSD